LDFPPSRSVSSPGRTVRSLFFLFSFTFTEMYVAKGKGNRANENTWGQRNTARGGTVPGVRVARGWGFFGWLSSFFCQSREVGKPKESPVVSRYGRPRGQEIKSRGGGSVTAGQQRRAARV
jgi:hypothetical protein